MQVWEAQVAKVPDTCYYYFTISLQPTAVASWGVLNEQSIEDETVWMELVNGLHVI